MTDAIFPMRLTAFEEYMLTDDLPSHPMQFIYRLEVRGQVNRETFETALTAAIARHPLLRAKAEKSRHWQWVSCPHDKCPVTWKDHSAINPDTVRLDVRQQPGVHVVVRQTASHAQVDFHFHHSCCDGGGADQFVQDVLNDYHSGQTGSGEPRRLDAGRLRQRSCFRKTTAIWRQFVGLLGVGQFFFHRPQPLIPHRADVERGFVAAGDQGLVSLDIDRGETKHLRRAAQTSSISVNDFLTSRVMLAVHQWRASRSLDLRPWLRWSVPVSLRSSHDTELPAANVVSMVFLDRRGADYDDPHELACGIRRQMNRIQKNQLAWTFIWALRLFRRIPHGLRLATGGNHCRASALITNVGAVLNGQLPRVGGKVAVGELLVEGVLITTPNRPLQCLGVSIVNYADQLRMTLTYDARALSTKDAQTIIAALRSHLELPEMRREAAA